MKASSLLFAVLVALLIVPAASATYLLRVVADDIVSYQDINPSTISINGQTLQGTPRAQFLAIPEGTYLELSGSAAGYNSRTDDQFYDANLPSCIGLQTCDLALQSAHPLLSPSAVGRLSIRTLTAMSLTITLRLITLQAF